MNKRLSGLGLALACMSVATAQPAQEEPRPWAEKLFGPPENLVHDFGVAPFGAQLRHDFVMTNIYAIPIEINGVRGSGGAVWATPSKRILQPKETATISVRMDGRRFYGYKSGTVFLTVSAPRFCEIRLTVTARSSPKISCDPGEFAFGSVACGETPSKTVDVEYQGPLAWQIAAIAPHEAPFRAMVKELYRRADKVGYRVSVTLTKDAAPGPFHSRVLLKTNDPNCDLLSIPVNGSIQEK